jgi:hypothetical protein
MGSASGIFSLIVAWVVGAVHLQLYLNDQGLLVASSISSDRWNRICHYYKPGKVVKLRIPANGSCELRLMPPGARTAKTNPNRG